MATRATYFPELLVGIRKPTTDQFLNAGTVTFYEAGTTTLKTVWNDKDKTSAADNPKTLSAYGTAAVYGDGIYKLLIKDSLGNTVYTWDYYKLRYYNVSVTSKSAAYNATVDDDLILVDTSGGNVAITLPQASTASTPIYVKKTSGDANSVVVTAYSGDLVDGGASATFSAEGYTAAYFSNSANNWYGSADTTNATTLGGYSASQTPAASTVVVAQTGSTYIHDNWVDWATKAGAGLSFTASDPIGGVLSVNVGAGLSVSGDNIIANPDNVTIEISGNVFQVKDGTYTASSTGAPVNGQVGTTLVDGRWVLKNIQGTATKVAEFRTALSGALYSSFYLQNASGSSTVYGRIYINGSAVGTNHSSISDSYAEKTDSSIAVNVGDLIQIYISGGNPHFCHVRDWQLRTSTAKDTVMPCTYIGEGA